MESKNTSPITRFYFLDNVRTFMIFLVILVHAALVYEKSGFPKPWWIVFNGSESDFPGMLFFILDIFVMFTIFFISGYLTPLSLKRKSPVEFIKTKFKRLMIPWLLAVFTLVPLYKFFFLYSRNLPQQDWTTYFHFSSGFGQSWLWFLPILFIFDLLYLLLSKLDISVSDINLKKGVFLVFIASVVYSFTIDIAGIGGWTKTWLVDFQNERLFSYFMIFLLGSLCSKLKIFDSQPSSKTFYYVMNGIAWIPVMIYLFFFLYPYLSGGKFIFSKTLHSFIMWNGFYLSVLTMLYISILTFQLYFNKQGTIARELNGNSYNVYIIHLIVMGALGTAMLDLAIHPLIKFLILTCVTWVVSNILVSVYRAVKQKIRVAVSPQ